jgi:hypothetical protein
VWRKYLDLRFCSRLIKNWSRLEALLAPHHYSVLSWSAAHLLKVWHSLPNVALEYT